MLVKVEKSDGTQNLLDGTINLLLKWATSKNLLLNIFQRKFQMSSVIMVFEYVFEFLSDGNFVRHIMLKLWIFFYIQRYDIPKGGRNC